MFSHLKERKNIFMLGAVLALTFIALSPCLKAEFMTNWDDGVHLVEYPLVRSLSMSNIKAIFKDTINEVYLPLTTLSFAIEYHFFKYNPFVYHLDNLIFHLLITAMVFFLALRLGLSRMEATLASLLFGIHPMHVESVAWITERKDVLYAFFYVWALHHYLRYMETDNFSHYAATLFLGILSLLAKPMGLSLVLILLLFDWFRDRKFGWQVLLEKVPFVIYTVPITWITYRMHMRVPVDQVDQALLIWVWTLIFYLRQFFLPFVFIPLYSLPSPIAINNPQYAFSVVTFILLCGMLFRFRKNRWVVFAFVFYFASIFFLLRTDIQWDMNIVADRFMYLPSVGFCLLFAVFVKKKFEAITNRFFVAPKIFALGIAILFLWLGIKTFLQTERWKNNQSLWNYVIEKIKMGDLSYIAYNNRAVFYMDHNEMGLALNDLNTSVQINPDTYYLSYYNRGIVYMNTGFYDLAIGDYTKAISLKPQFADAYNNRGLLYAAKGEDQKAIADFFMCATINPKEPKCYVNRGRFYRSFGRYALAHRDFQRAKGLGWEFEEE